MIILAFYLKIYFKEEILMNQKLEKMLLEEEKLKALSKMKNHSEIMKFFKENGIEITEEKAKKFIEIRDEIDKNPPKEDPEAFLSKVSGGGSFETAKFVGKVMLGTLVAVSTLESFHLATRYLEGKLSSGRTVI